MFELIYGSILIVSVDVLCSSQSDVARQSVYRGRGTLCMYPWGSGPTVPFLTMAQSPSSSSNQHSARYYNGAGFGVNVFLRCHIDNDFTMSIVQVHMDRCYQDDDPIVCYFCFPQIGCAVALWPGNIFMFNPQEPHCISSWCNSDDQVYCISCYLKTSVVGLNDNSNLTI